MYKEKIVIYALKLPGASESIEGPSGIQEEFPDLSLASLLNKAIPLIFTFAGLALFGYLIYGGFKYLLALGDEQSIGEARGTITNALIGFVVVFAAYWLTKLFGAILGVAIF